MYTKNWCQIARSWTRLLLQWRHYGREGVSNPRRSYCLLNRLFRRRSKNTSKLRVTGLCEGTGDRGKCFHFMTSSWLIHTNPLGPITYVINQRGNHRSNQNPVITGSVKPSSRAMPYHHPSNVRKGHTVICIFLCDCDKNASVEFGSLYMISLYMDCFLWYRYILYGGPLIFMFVNDSCCVRLVEWRWFLLMFSPLFMYSCITQICILFSLLSFHHCSWSLDDVFSCNDNDNMILKDHIDHDGYISLHHNISSSPVEASQTFIQNILWKVRMFCSR